MAEQVSVPVTSLHQATDPERFRPEHGQARITSSCSWPTRGRSIAGSWTIWRARPTTSRSTVGNWTPDLVDPRFVEGRGVANTELARYYSAADIVLNDHWNDMRFEGFISNRLYDALACGAFVISDEIDGIAAEFDGAVPTYRIGIRLER